MWKRLVGSMLSSIPAASTYGNASMKLQTLRPDFCNDVSYICMPYTTYTTFTGPVRLTRKVVLLFHGHIFKISVLRLCPRKFIKYMYAPWTCNVRITLTCGIEFTSCPFSPRLKAAKAVAGWHHVEASPGVLFIFLGMYAWIICFETGRPK